jgi:hypothetical protein
MGTQTSVIFMNLLYAIVGGALTIALRGPRAVLAMCVAVALFGLTPTALAGPKGTTKTEFDEHFRKYAKHYFGVGTDWHWFKSQAMTESNLNPNAQSCARRTRNSAPSPNRDKTSPQASCTTSSSGLVTPKSRSNPTVGDSCSQPTTPAQRPCVAHAIMRGRRATMRRPGNL